MDESYLKPWLALSHMEGMSPLLFNRLLKQFKSPQNILNYDSALLSAPRIKPALRAAIKSYQTAGKSLGIERKVEASLEWQEKDQSHHILCKESEYYPDLLKELADSPPILYLKGDPAKLVLPQLAMVGSRNPGAVGRKNAQHFAREISQAGFLVCSGMALGIDYESHRGALDAGEATLAVLGTGIDQIYPPQNRGLAQKIIENGALISEFPLGTKPMAYNFPQRNRIISGMSQGTLVVEAALRSGSLITARFALEQGREVFAIPGSIHSATARGCHLLIKQGAKLVENVNDILEELSAFIALAKEQLPSEGSVEKLPEYLGLVLAEIDYEPVNIDSLVTSTGLEITKVIIVLMQLELKGLIQIVAGGYTLAIK